jgi:hypothetical protein
MKPHDDKNNGDNDSSNYKNNNYYYYDLAITFQQIGLNISLLWCKHIFSIYDINRSWHSVVGIATGYGLDDRGVGVRVPVGSRIFSSPHHPDRLWGPHQPPIQWVPGALSPGAKRPGREVDHSPPNSAEVKKMWIYTSIPIRLHDVVLN